MATMIEDLLRSGLTPADLLAYEEASFNNCYRIPYFLPDGNFHPRMYRRRFLDVPPGGKRYGQPSTKDIVAAGGVASEATFPYLNPRVLNGVTWADIAANATPRRLYAIEGEKKSVAVALRCKVFAFGFGGCWNLLVRDDNGIFQLHPEVVKLLHAGDELHIGLDSDMMTNAEVARAAGSIRRACLRIGVRPLFIVCPPAPNGHRQGLDDWLLTVQAGTEIAALDALPRVTGQGLPEDHLSLWHWLGLTLGDTKKLTPHSNEANLKRLFTLHERYTGGLFWYDEVRGFIYEESTGKSRSLTDEWVSGELTWAQDALGMHKLSLTMFYTALVACAMNHYRRNLVRDALKVSVWDKTPRLESMFIDGFGAEDTSYVRSIGQNWLVGCVQRIFEPGCQLDTMMVLEGPQGHGKSSALSIIGGEYYVELTGDSSSKDFVMTAHSGWIVDLIELASLRRSDVAHMKGFITTRTDTYRPPYGRATVSRARHFVMVGTSNTSDYLTDSTGNRRFWPVRCNGDINLDWLRANRDQLLAEATFEYMAGRKHWDIPASLAAAEQALRVSDNPLVDTLTGILASPALGNAIVYKGQDYRFVATSELTYALGTPTSQQRGEAIRISEAMRMLPGWTRHFYGNTARPLTLSSGVLVTSANGYVCPIAPTLAPPALVSDNVLPLTPPGGKKFAAT